MVDLVDPLALMACLFLIVHVVASIFTVITFAFERYKNALVANARHMHLAVYRKYWLHLKSVTVELIESLLMFSNDG